MSSIVCQVFLPFKNSETRSIFQRPPTRRSLPRFVLKIAGGSILRILAILVSDIVLFPIRLSADDRGLAQDEPLLRVSRPYRGEVLWREPGSQYRSTAWPAWLQRPVLARG